MWEVKTTKDDSHRLQGNTNSIQRNLYRKKGKSKRLMIDSVIQYSVGINCQNKCNRRNTERKSGPNNRLCWWSIVYSKEQNNTNRKLMKITIEARKGGLETNQTKAKYMKIIREGNRDQGREVILRKFWFDVEESLLEVI